MLASAPIYGLLESVISKHTEDYWNILGGIQVGYPIGNSLTDKVKMLSLSLYYTTYDDYGIHSLLYHTLSAINQLKSPWHTPLYDILWGETTIQEGIHRSLTHIIGNLSIPLRGDNPYTLTHNRWQRILIVSR